MKAFVTESLGVVYGKQAVLFIWNFLRRAVFKRPPREKKLYILTSQEGIKGSVVETVLRNTFEFSEISEIFCFPSVYYLANRFPSKTVSFLEGRYFDLVERFKGRDVSVIVFWNGNSKDRMAPIIGLLRSMRKEFFLFNCGSELALEYIFDGSVKCAEFSLNSLAKRVKIILKSHALNFKPYKAATGSIYYTTMTCKPLQIRISDHEPRKDLIERSGCEVFNMGLYKGADGLIPEFKRWLERQMPVAQ